MTEEEKELLIKDLCARLPYNPCVLVEFEGSNQEWKTTLQQEYCVGYISGKITKLYSCEITVKPYLRQMSSMTEEERCEHYRLKGHSDWQAQDYLDSIHVDYRGLIWKGLALEAPEGMYNN